MTGENNDPARTSTFRSGLLPALVRRFFERNVPASGQVPRQVRLAQVGEMQLKPGRWMEFEASQEISVERVEFSWRARFRLAPLVSMRVVDWYRAGEGGLDGRLWGLVPLVRGRGPEFANGEAMRYLAEIAWVPQAIVANRSLSWSEQGDREVEVSTHVAATPVSVCLQFDPAGDIVGASGMRPRLAGKETIDTPFRGQFADYREIGGLRLPTAAEVAWELDEGPLTYFRGRVTDFELD